MSVFRLTGASFTYPAAGRAALTDVSLDVGAGSMTALLGPNGSGKSTLLRVMLGELVGSGAVEYEDRPVGAWKRREIARRIAFVPQSEPMAFPLTVRQLAEMGRYPHVGVLGRAGARDERAIAAAMERAGVEHFADRPLTTLSGGERQRARIARALAQEPTTLVLDEPTAARDLHYEMETFELMRTLCRQEGLTVVVATHNLNLAARYASDVVLLSEGRIESAGPPAEVVTRDTIERVYRWSVAITPHPGPGPDAGAPQVVPLSSPS